MLERLTAQRLCLAHLPLEWEMRWFNKNIQLSTWVSPPCRVPLSNACRLFSAFLFSGRLILLGSHSLGLPWTSGNRGRNWLRSHQLAGRPGGAGYPARTPCAAARHGGLWGTGRGGGDVCRQSRAVAGESLGCMSWASPGWLSTRSKHSCGSCSKGWNKMIFLKGPVWNLGLTQWTFGIRVSLNLPFILFLISQSAFEFLAWRALWAFKDMQRYYDFWWVERNPLLQSLGKGNPCSKLATDSKRQLWPSYSHSALCHVFQLLFSLPSM